MNTTHIVLVSGHVLNLVAHMLVRDCNGQLVCFQTERDAKCWEHQEGDIVLEFESFANGG